MVFKLYIFPFNMLKSGWIRLAWILGKYYQTRKKRNEKQLQKKQKNISKGITKIISIKYSWDDRWWWCTGSEMEELAFELLVCEMNYCLVSCINPAPSSSPPSPSLSTVSPWYYISVVNETFINCKIQKSIEPWLLYRRDFSPPKYMLHLFISLYLSPYIYGFSFITFFFQTYQWSHSSNIKYINLISFCNLLHINLMLLFNITHIVFLSLTLCVFSIQILILFDKECWHLCTANGTSHILIKYPTK